MAQEIVGDVVIVGLGGAGAAAAITAAEAGARVVVIEKTEDGGGSTRDSGATIRTIADVEDAVRHCSLLTEERTPEAVVRAFVEGAERLPRWVVDHKGRCWESPLAAVAKGQIYPAINPGSAFREIDGAGGLGPRYRVVPPEWTEEGGPRAGGVTLWQVLARNLADLDLEVLYSAQAERLRRDPASGRVTGVDCRLDGDEVHVRAERGVVLTSGGFADDRSLKFDAFGGDLPTLCSPGRRTGDGIRMAQAVGAALWHMNALASRFGYRVPGHDAAFCCQVCGPGFIIVDQHANRYINEAKLDSHAAGLCALVPDPLNGRYLRLPSFLIFDEETRFDGPIANTTIGYNASAGWSRDNALEIQKGWISSAETVDDLAVQLGIPSDTLAATVAGWNSVCDDGAEDRYGRPVGSRRSIGSPPFYGIALWPALYNTQGGPRRDERARVIDVWGAPIPGLYSAGELGSMWSTFYPGSGNVTEALVFGQIAGREAAAGPRA